MRSPQAAVTSPARSCCRFPWKLIQKCLLAIAAVCCFIRCETGSAKQSASRVRDSPTDRPFPLNRVKNFYFHQAEELMDVESIPDLIPQFPGLDGGAFGHWGQNPEDVNFDHTLNDVETGNVVCQVVNHFGSTTNKGVAVRIDDLTKTSALFDHE